MGDQALPSQALHLETMVSDLHQAARAVRVTPVASEDLWVVAVYCRREEWKRWLL